MDILHYSFMQHAFIVAFLSSILVGLAGSVLELNSLGSVTGGLVHVLLAGVGIASYFQVDPFIGALTISVIASYFLARQYVYNFNNLSVLSNILWGLGVSVGVLFLSFSSGYQQSLTTFLFGNIVLVSLKDIYHLLFLDIVAIFFVLLFFRQMILLSFSVSFAYLQRLPILLLTFIFILLISFSLLSLIKTVGTALALILIVIPINIFKRFSFGLGSIIILSSILSFFCMVLGMIISYYYNIPSGAIISFIMVGFFILSVLIFRKKSF